MALREAFRALEVPEGSDLETCKKAYREMARKYHPDMWMSDGDQEKREIAEKIFQTINASFDLIKAHYGEE